MIAGLDVSRETMDRLEHYLGMLEKWNPAINLVSKATLKDAWDRHFVDSAQIYASAPDGWTHWADFGSGGGFPGAVIAVIAAEKNPDAKVTLVESDKRKSAFLRSVLRETGVTATVLSSRIEEIEPLQADVISARALAELSQLLAFAELHGTEKTTCLFPKGATWEKELLQAQESWKFDHDSLRSETDPKAIILRIGGLCRG